MPVRSSMIEVGVVLLNGLMEKAMLVAGAGRSRPHPRKLHTLLVG